MYESWLSELAFFNFLNPFAEHQAQIVTYSFISQLYSTYGNSWIKNELYGYYNVTLLQSP